MPAGSASTIPAGRCVFNIEPTGDDLFLQLPDFDDPLDDDSDGTYEVTVHVEGGGDQQTLDVEVTVTDEPEPGTLALSSTQPQLGETLTTTLTDPDGVTGAVTYVWERSVGRGTWVTLADTAASRVPTAADSGHFLRVTATYEDGHGSANTAAARTSEVVTADRLTALAVSTTDSTANPGHALRPSFDAGILHYSIGCAASEDDDPHRDRGLGRADLDQRDPGHKRREPHSRRGCRQRGPRHARRRQRRSYHLLRAVPLR